MSDQPYKPYLDCLFENCEALMAELIAKNGGYFTNQQFLKEMARRNPIAYIDLLYSTKEHYLKTEPPHEHKWIFNAAHQAIGGRLSNEAKKAGYLQQKTGRDEIDIWGNPTGEVRYYQPR